MNLSENFVKKPVDRRIYKLRIDTVTDWNRNKYYRIYMVLIRKFHITKGGNFVSDQFTTIIRNPEIAKHLGMTTYQYRSFLESKESFGRVYPDGYEFFKVYSDAAKAIEEIYNNAITDIPYNEKYGIEITPKEEIL